MAAMPSRDPLMATHNCHRLSLGSTSSNSSCQSAQCPGKAIPHHPASFSGSLISCSWPQCWSPQSTWNLPRPPPA
ncbi:pancreatic progenitor cell differentiation and proliferation factor-like isoform X2 [Hippopotamus amphibius kiboko]|uniref:pancreatic progenitor cell differentiation and proliferation factor-like isoform X2 n=1 Tax=Hippopotamus amphibius kiboko TaxID=575201 RepID=UPI0025935962|nr:pancreatic progenitor cell differentiation and proliferation factor-like isoform X2 [Hippopotamus amphibius kiboko]